MTNRGRGNFLSFIADFGDMIGACIIGMQLGSCKDANVSSILIGGMFILVSIFLKKYNV